MPSMSTGKAGYVLAAMVDPFLGWFRRFHFLHMGRFDFSPIAGLALLSVLNEILSTLAFVGKVTIGGVLAMSLGALWSALAFFLTFFAIAALARIIAYMAHWNSLHPVWMIIDDMLNPILFRLTRVVYRERIVNYLQGLATGLAILVLLRFGGEALVSVIIRLLRSLPV
jgi:YggT family protein